MAAKPQPDLFDFEGYDSPTYTPVPDQLLDEHLAILSGAELKVVLYICRRTFGFKRDSDNISLSQMLHGIVTHDGRRLDSGTGLSKPALIGALKSLTEKNIVIAQQRASAEKGNEPTNYRLNIRTPLGKKTDQGELNNFTPLGKESLLGGVNKIDQGLVKKVYQGLGKKTLPTTNSSTTNSSTTNSSNNNNRAPDDLSLEKDFVVVVLTSFGVEEKVAQKLVDEHSAANVREKIAFLEFLQAERPAEVQKPAGWLRKAIENNYGPPDGFKSPAQRAAEAAQQAQWEAEQQRLEAEAERRFQVEQARRVAETQQKYQTEAERTAQLHAYYGASPEEQAIWTQVLAELELQMAETGRAQLMGSTLLQVREGKALVALRDGFMRDWVQRQLSPKIQRVLGQRLGYTVTLQFTDIQAAEAAMIERPR